MKQPKVSILSAVRNEETYIGEMIASVLRQTLPDWELLFVDDGSTDRTVDIIESHSSADSRIKLVGCGKKCGKAAAFNQAFSASSGDIVVLLAGDDTLPERSLEVRHAAVRSLPTTAPAVGFFKIRTFSTDPRFDGMVLPRGRSASRSGGSIAMNRCLASALFPVDSSLASEDIWLAYGSVGLAEAKVEQSDVVLHYRIHPGNSNPRQRTFDEMTESLHERHRAWEALLKSHLPLSRVVTERVESLWAAEQLRYRGKVLPLLRTPLPAVERLAMAATASTSLYYLRSRFYKSFSGRRGQ